MSDIRSTDTTKLLFIECAKSDPDIEIIKNLILSGIDPNAVDDGGYSPLMLYMFRSNCPNSEIITILVKAGIQITKKNKHDSDMTALLYAVYNTASIGVYETLFQLGANPKDLNLTDDILTLPESYIEALGDEDRALEEPHRSNLDYFQRLIDTNNVENTMIDGIPLYKALENYIINANNPEPNEISKIIKSYSHIPGIYPCNSDITCPPDDYFPSCRVSYELFHTLNVFYIAAQKRCSIEVFQTLLLEYGIDMAERFDVNLREVLGGNYRVIKPNSDYFEDSLHNEVISRYMDVENILTSYTYSENTSCSPFNINTLKYLTTIVNLKFGQVCLDINDPDCFNHPTHPAIIFCTRLYPDSEVFLEIIDIFVKSDMDINIINNSGGNLLMVFLNNQYNNNPDLRVISALVKAGIDVNYVNKERNNMTVLMSVATRCYDDHIGVFKTLIELGADMYHLDLNGFNVLTIYILQKQHNSYDQYDKEEWDQHNQTLKYLISQIDPVRFKHNERDLFLYCRKAELDFDIFQFLLEHTPNIKFVDFTGYDCLMNYLFCVRNPDVRIIIALVDGGIDINRKNPQYNFVTSYMLAKSRNHSNEILQCLIDNGAIID